MNKSKRVADETCPVCGKPMKVALIVPRVAGHAELRSFKCTGCGEVVTKPVDKDE